MLANPPYISVIIPVYNDAERLKMCLRALEAQTYPKNCYEVIVVDNGSAESIAPVVAQFPQAKALYEAQPGSYAARNAGIAAARGEILAFTDADCIPAADWLEKGVARLTDTPNCGLVGGRLEPRFADPTRPSALELYEVIMYYPQQRFVEVLNFSVTANLFTFRQVIERVGGFAPSLKSSGDREWGQRVALAGYRLVYAADVCVVHPVRNSFADIRQKVVRLAGGYEERRLAARSQSLRGIVQEFVTNLLPPIRSVRRFATSHHVMPGTQVATIAFWGIMKGLEIMERVRIKLGFGQPAR